MTERLVFCCIILALLLLGPTVYKPYIVHKTTVEVTEKLTTQYEIQYQNKVKAALEAEREILNKKIDAERKKNEKAEKDNARLSSLVDSLQQRPTRKSRGGDTKSAPSDGTCTGAGLYQDDGVFLAWLAGEAERMKKERDYYYELYENARKKLEELKGKR